MTARRIEFVSLSEYAKYAALAPANDDSCAHRSGERFEWTHGVTLEEAVQMAEHGWAEGAVKAKTLLDKMPPPLLENVMTGTVHDVVGSYVDVGEYVMGTPECMVNFCEDKRTARFARIVVAGCYAGGVTGQTIINRGVAIAAIVDALEANGVRCDIDMVTRQNKHGRDVWETCVSLKRATDPLNLDTLVFAIAHPACFRRIGFAVCERETPAMRKMHSFMHSGSYGSVQTLPPDPSAIIFQVPYFSEDWSAETASRKVMEILARYTKGADNA